MSTTTKPKAVPSSLLRPLHVHLPRPHTVRNANAVRAQARIQQTGMAGFNKRLAVRITGITGTMECAYAFAVLGIGSLLGILINNAVLAGVCGAVSSYFLQLVLLPILSNGQEQQGEHAAIQSDEQYKAVVNTEHDAEQMIAHLSAQDTVLQEQMAELLKQTPMLAQILTVLAGGAVAGVSPIASVNGTHTTNVASNSSNTKVRIDAPPVASVVSVASVRAPSRRKATKPAEKALTPQQRRSNPLDPPLQDS